MIVSGTYLREHNYEMHNMTVIGNMPDDECPDSEH